MKRITHRLRENKGLEAPALKVFIDTEANRQPLDATSEMQTLWFGWLLFEREQTTKGKTWKAERWHRFETASDAWDLLESFCQPKMVLYVYAHNWDYDGAMLSMEEESGRRGWRLDSYVRSSHFLWAKFKRDSLTILFIDTLNYFPISLARLGDSMAVPKLTMPDLADNANQWDIYCKRDVEVIRQAINNLLSVVHMHDLGNFAKTAASQAFNAYKHHYMKTRPLILNDERISLLERASYYGGRVECFNRNPQRRLITYLDINSMYPFVMRENEYPFQKLRKGQFLSLAEMAELLERRSVTATCYLNARASIYPKRINDVLCFPIGRFWTVLSTPEIKLALERNELEAVGDWVSYAHAPLFADYVNDLYALRLNYDLAGNAAFSTMVKLLLNSLYGKFGQRGRRWLLCHETYEHTEDEFVFDCQRKGVALVHRTRFGRVLHELRDEEAFDSMPAIAAHVTAYARVYLWRLLEIAGQSHALYCDTDSIFVDKTGLKNLATSINAKEMGALKVAGSATYAHFIAPKFYHFGTIKHRKGIRDNARQLDEQLFEQDQFQSYDVTLGQGKEGQIIVRKVQKFVRLNYRKGITGADGIVRPFELAETEADRPESFFRRRDND